MEGVLQKKPVLCGAWRIPCLPNPVGPPLMLFVYPHRHRHFQPRLYDFDFDFKLLFAQCVQSTRIDLALVSVQRCLLQLHASTTMASNQEDLIDFNIIESHKENIQSLPSGRSAKALAALYSPPLSARPSGQSDPHAAERAVFDAEVEQIQDADDPLDVYDRYVKWTLATYPSAQSTPHSRLLPLLEHATKAFLSDGHYKNDVRYLRLWLHYVGLFSDAPKETFVFMARNGVGQELALFYEEYAAWLEAQGRWSQAEEVYTIGIEKEARPAERLIRKYGEFERRKAALPKDVAERPDSPVLPVVRQVLGQKVDPFVAAAASAQAQQETKAADKGKKKTAKMAIFADDGAEKESVMGSKDGQSWDSIGSLHSRKRENTVEATSWAGQTMKVGKTNAGVEKMQIFRVSTPLSPTSQMLRC